MTYYPVSNSFDIGRDYFNSQQFWTQWATQTIATITTNTTTNCVQNQIWGLWNGQQISSAVTLSSTTGNIFLNNAWSNWNVKQTETLEARNARLEQEHVARVEAMKRARLQRAANRLARIKARRILLDNLNEMQRKDFLEKKFFKLYVEDRVYRIEHGRSRNIRLVKEETGKADKVLKTYCVHPVMEVPDEDTMLVQKLMLESTEQDFLKIANVTEGYTPLMRGAMAA